MTMRSLFVRGWLVGLGGVAVGCSGDDVGRDDASGSATSTATAGLSTSATATTTAGGSASESDGTTTAGGASESATGSASESDSGASASTTAGESDTATTTTTTTTTTGDTGESTTTGEPVDDCKDELEEIGERPAQIWISNTTVGTVTKIDTETAVITGRYVTNSAQAYQPSRTTVNDLGDMLVGHRENPGGVTKIAGSEKNCVDLNNNGTIETSTGFDDVRPWGQDECVLWHQDTPGTAGGARAVAWEPSSFNKDTCEYDNPNPRVWVAFRPSAAVGRVYRLDGATGEILDAIDVDIGDGLTYGGAVDADGGFWFTARSGPFLIHIDADTLAVEKITTPNNPYGVAIDKLGNPFLADYHQGAGVDAITRYNRQTKTFEQTLSLQGRHRGIQIDTKEIAWVAGNAPCRLVKVDTATNTLLDDAIPLPGCADPVGVSIDEEGDVWVVDRGASVAYEIDPNTHEVKNTVTDLKGPYTYSDMTGGSLRLVQDPMPG